MKKLLILLLIIPFLSACNNKDTNTEFKDTDEITNYIKITMSDNEVMIAELYEDIAPLTVANFQKLISEGFYDGLTIHRVVPGFVIQGGDPNGDGTGGSEETIPGEFYRNDGIERDISHTKGVLSMARSTSMDSASSQFFICLEEATSLDGNYAAFGEVVEGIDVVDDIASTETSGETPVVAPVIKTITFVEKK